MTREWAIVGLVLAAFGIGIVSGQMYAGYIEQRTCRHTLQMHFGKTSEEAQRLINETRLWEIK